MIILKLTALLCLGTIFYLDLKYRAVYWIIFPILSTAFCFLKQMQVGFHITLVDAGFDFLFFSVQLLFLWLYFSVKHRRSYNIISNKIGLGDILFLTSVIFYLSPLNYVVFYIASLIFVLFFVSILKLLKIKIVEIPLAGLQSLCLAILLIAEVCFPHLILIQDISIYNSLFISI
jgi:hypothetical protein